MMTERAQMKNLSYSRKKCGILCFAQNDNRREVFFFLALPQLFS